MLCLSPISLIRWWYNFLPSGNLFLVIIFDCNLTQGIIGTGTCVLSKVPIVDAVFHEFSMNGYPHQVRAHIVCFEILERENSNRISMKIFFRFCTGIGLLEKVLGWSPLTSMDWTYMWGEHSLWKIWPVPLVSTRNHHLNLWNLSRILTKNRENSKFEPNFYRFWVVNLGQEWYQRQNFHIPGLLSLAPTPPLAAQASVWKIPRPIKLLILSFSKPVMSNREVEPCGQLLSPILHLRQQQGFAAGDIFFISKKISYNSTFPSAYAWS